MSLQRVNDSNEIDYSFDVLGLGASVKPFGKFYNELCQIIQSGPPIDPAACQTDTPPIQTVVPPGLRHSSPSAASTVSTSSAESTYEHHTHSCANAFLFATLQATEVEKHCWWPKEYTVRHTEFSPFWVSIMSREQTMKIKAGQSVQGKKVRKLCKE